MLLQSCRLSDFFHHRFFIAASMALTSIRFKDTFWKKFRIWPNFSVKSKRISFLFFQQRAMSCCKRKCNFHGAVVCTPFTFFYFVGQRRKPDPDVLIVVQWTLQTQGLSRRRLYRQRRRCCRRRRGTDSHLVVPL